MSGVPLRYLWRQRRVIASLGASAFGSLLAPLLRRGRAAGEGGAAPEIVTQVAPLPPALLRDYVRYCGGDPDAYDGLVPAHLFPQWSFHLAVRTTRGLPYSLMRTLNAGCRLEMNAPLPAGVPFEARARLEGVDDDGRRALIRHRLATGAPGRPDAVVAHVFEVAPSHRPRNPERVPNLPRRARTSKAGPPPRERLVPDGARELLRFRLGRQAGLHFALLTGDFNPVHWVRPWARALGFRGTILHGFATLAHAIEGLRRTLFPGAGDRLRVVDVRFVRPLVLPADVGLYVQDTALFVGDAPGAPAYLAGSFDAT